VRSDGPPLHRRAPNDPGERMRRYRVRKRGSDVRPITYRPPPAVTKPVTWATTKPPWRFEPLATVETALQAGQRRPMAGLGSYQAPNRRSDAQSGSWVRVRGASGEVIEIASLIG
jgi:hypothetical protein